MDRQITKLKEEIYALKKENKNLKLQLISLDKGHWEFENWTHPNSCLHNKDPWITWKE
jgi:hypothetical protein|tara:strand:- start:29 stop:202 length:174 start_codon:yes stop_codon:yes gene_type:complete